MSWSEHGRGESLQVSPRRRVNFGTFVRQQAQEGQVDGPHDESPVVDILPVPSGSQGDTHPVLEKWHPA
jgi:hypothetical protein